MAESSSSSEDEAPAKKAKSPKTIKAAVKSAKKETPSSSSDSSDSDGQVLPKKMRRMNNDAVEVTKSKTPKKVKKEEEFTVNGNTRKRNAPFRRVIEEDVAVDPRLKDMSYLAKKGANEEEYGFNAAKGLLKVKGKGFTREKNKKKRGSGVHGKIDTGNIHSIKFDNWSESD